MVNIDERVMTMKFDNSQFRRAAAETIGDLGNLRRSVKMDGVTSGLTKLSDPVKDLGKTIKSSDIKGGLKGISTAATQSFSEIESSAKGVSLDGITAGVDNAKRSFLSLGDIASVALGGLAVKGVEKAIGGLKGFYDNTLGQIQTGGMARAKNLEQANFMLGGIMDTEAQIKDVMAAANRAVDGTAYGLDQAAKAAAQFAASDVPIDKMQTSLTGIVGVAAMTSSEFDDIARIFTTVAGNGRVFATELNSIGARGINAAAALADHFGVTEEAVRKMVSDGKVNFDDFSTAMAEAFGPQAAKANDTYSGSLSNVRSALSRIGADTAAVKLEGMRDVFNALRPIINGVNSALKPFIGLLNDNLRSAFAAVVGPMTKFGDAFTAFFDPKQGPAFAGAFRPVIEFIQDIGMVAGLVTDVFKDMVAVIFGASPKFIEMSNSTTKVGTTIQHIFRKLLSVIMLVPEIIGMIIKAFRGTTDSAGSMGMSILELVDKISGFLYITAEVIRKSKALNIIVGVIGGLFRIAAGGVAVFLKAISLVVDGIVKLRNPLDILKDIVNFAKDHFSKIFDGLRTDGLDKFIKFVVDSFNKLKNVVKNFSFTKLFKGFKIPNVNLSGFKSISKIFDNLRESVGKVVSGIKALDWSPLTTMFSGGFTMPSLSGIGAIGSGIGSALMGGVQNLSWAPVQEFASNTMSTIRDLTANLRGIDWSGVWSRVTTSVQTGATSVGGVLVKMKDNVVAAGKTIGGAMADFGQWALDGLRNVDWAALGNNIGNGIVKAFTYITGSAAAIVSFLSDFFTSVIDSVDWSGMLEGLLNIQEKIQGSFSEISKAFKGEDIDTSYLEEALGSATADITINATRDLGSKAKSIRESISDFFGVLFGTGPDSSAEDAKLVQGTMDFGNQVKDVATTLKNPFATAKDAVTSEFTGFGDTIKTATQGLLEGVNLVEILNGIGIAFAGAGLFKMSETLQQFAAVPEAIAGALTSIGTSIESFGQAAKIEAQGNAIVKIAIALGILAAAVWFMSKIPWDQMKVGLGAVIILLGTLVASVILMDKMLSDDAGAKLNAIGNAMMKIGIAIGILAFSVWLLGNMDMGTLLQGLGAVLLTIITLAGGAALAGMAKSIQGMGAAFMGLAMAVFILASAFIMFKFINWDEMLKGFATLAVVVGGIAILTKVADGKKLAGAGLAMLGIGVGLFALAFGLKAIGNLDEAQLIKGLSVLAGVMVGITLMTKFGGGNLVATAGTLVGISFALIGLAFAISLIADIDFWDAVGGMTVLIGGLAGLGLALKAFPPTAPAIAASLLGIAGAFAIMIVAIKILGNMDLGQLVQGIGALAAIMVGLGFAVSKIPPNSLMNLLGMSAAFIALAASMLILAHAMQVFDTVSWESLGKAGSVAAGVLLALTGLAAIGHFGGVGLTMLGLGLAAIGAGLLVIAGAVWVFSDAVEKIVDSLKTLSDIGDSVKDALQNAGEGITLFAEEAGDGLRELFDIIGFFGAGKVTALGKLFSSFGDIPTDIKERMTSFKEGLDILQDAMPTLNEIKTFTEEGGDAKFLKNFFGAFNDIDMDVGDRIQSFVDGISKLRDVKGIMNEIQGFGVDNSRDGGWFNSLMGNNTGKNSTNFISDFFEVFNDIDVDVADKMTSIVDALSQLEEVMGMVNRLLNFGLVGADNENGFAAIDFISDFFEAFDKINEDAGANLSSVVDALGELQEVQDMLSTLQTFGAGGDEEGHGGIRFLRSFFQVFDDIDEDAGGKLKSLVSAVGELEAVMGTLENLKKLGGEGAGGEQGIFGAFKDISYLGDFFAMFDNIDAEAGANLDAFINSAVRIQEIIEPLNALKDFGFHGSGGATDMFGGFDDVSYITVFFSSLSNSISEDLGSKLSSTSEGMGDLQEAIPHLSTAIEGLQGLDVDSLGNIMSDISDALNSGISGDISGAAESIRAAVDAMLAAVTDRTSDFNSAGKELGSAVGTGVGDTTREVESAAKTLSNAAAESIRSGRSGMVSAGKYIANGVAEGIRQAQPGAVAAAKSLADAVTNAARVKLDIQSPSRVFKKIGGFVSEGLAIGIDSGQGMVRKAGSDLAAAGIEGFENIDVRAENAGRVFADSISKGFQNSSFNQRLTKLSIHSKAAHATAAKERKIDDMEEIERAEEEKRKIYEDVEEARKAMGEAKENLSNSEADAKTAKSKAKEGEKEKKQSLEQETKAVRDAQKKKDDIVEAERRYQKAIRERDKYEYRMHGEEAGVQFVDGVAVGLMSDKEAIPSVAEILADLLMDEVDTMKSTVGDYTDIFGGLATVSSTTKSMGDNIKDLGRAFKRLGTSTSSRSIGRNLSMMFDSLVGFGGGIQELIGVLGIFAPFLPALLQSFEHSLPAISALITPFAPHLATALGGGLATAVPAILGPATAIIAAVAGIGIFLWDQANDKTILKGLKGMFAGVGEFISGLPKMIVDGILVLLKGIKETLNDLPELVDFILTTLISTIGAVIQALPEVLPLLINGIIETLVWIIVNSPGILLEVAVAIINGLALAIETAIKSLSDILLMPFRWLLGEVGGELDLVKVMADAVDRMAKATGNIVRAALTLIISPFKGLINMIAEIFGLDTIGDNAVAGFVESIVGGMGRVMDFVAAPFIGLWNFIASIFGWRKLAKNAASDFVFGTADGINKNAKAVGTAAERMAALMGKHVKNTTKDVLADVTKLIDKQVSLIQAGATDGVVLGGEATRKAADSVWSDIESMFDMYGLGKGELAALANAFYDGTTNPATMVSSFNKVFDHIQHILTLNEIGEDAVDTLNEGMIDAIRTGMLDESMGEYNAKGYQTATEYSNGVINGMNATKAEVKSASELVWADIETVFDYYGLGDAGLKKLKDSYQKGTQNPATYASTFEKVFDAIEKTLLLEDIGTESVESLRTSMVNSVETVLAPGVRESMGAVRDETGGIFSPDVGEKIGEGIVGGIAGGIARAVGDLWDNLTSPFRNLWDWIVNLFTGGEGLGSSLIGDILGGLTSGVSEFFKPGVDLVKGLGSGITNAAGGVVDTVVGLGKGLVKGVKDFFGIRSPSRLMMSLGGYIIEGLGKGLSDSGDRVVMTMEDVGDDILGAARSILLGVGDIIDAEDDPVITPILDLSNLKDGVRNMMGLIPDDSLNIDNAMLTTSNIASLLSGVRGEESEVKHITNIEFQQTNTSPEPLSEYQIYRNTERALDQVVLRNR